MKAWTITFGEHIWTDEDATTAHLVAVSELLGDSWESVSPWNGPRSLAAWLAVLLATKSGDLDAAVSAVYAMPVAMLLATFGDREDAPPADPIPPSPAPADLPPEPPEPAPAAKKKGKPAASPAAAVPVPVAA